MPNMDFSNASMDDLKVSHFRSDAEKKSFLEAMYAGKVPLLIFFQADAEVRLFP